MKEINFQVAPMYTFSGRLKHLCLKLFSFKMELPKYKDKRSTHIEKSIELSKKPNYPAFI